MEADEPLCRVELDTHADTWCVGADCRVLFETGKTVNVSGFLESLGEVNQVKIVHAAVAYDCPSTFKTVVLIINQALHFPDLKHTLACPNQCRANGVDVYDTPRHLDPLLHDLSHSIYFSADRFAIPLHSRGVIS